MNAGASPSIDVDDIIVEIAVGSSDEPHPELAEELVALSKTLSAEPHTVMKRMVATAMSLTGAQSCGVSLLDETGGYFRWVETCGEFSKYLNTTLPRNFSPCGIVLDRRQPLIMREPARVFPYISEITPPVGIVLLVPFSRDDQVIGTIWVVKHNTTESFSTKDLNSVCAVADFASSIFESTSLVKSLKFAEKRAELLLEKSETARRLLETGFQLAPGFVALLRGKSFVFELVNEAYKRLVHKSDLIGQPLFEALPILQTQGFVTLLENILETGEAYIGEDLEVELVNSDGQKFTCYVDVVCQPLFDDECRVIGILVQGHDVTTKHDALFKLRQENENKQQFLSVVAHELRNPISGIRLASLLLRRTDGKDDPKQVHAVQAIDNHTEVLLRLVEDLIDVESMRTGKLKLQMEKVQLQAVVVNAVDTAQQYMSSRHQKFVLDVSEAPIYIYGDKIRLNQIFTNLLNNAAKYSPEGSTITIHALRRDEKVVVEVRDEGIGIAKDFLQRIFDIYMQVPRSEVLYGGGLGLGLALVRQLVDLHSGSIAASSDGLGKGSCFTVTLPLYQRTTAT